MKIAWFDCYAGISGDMCLGALVDAGVDIGDMMQGLSALDIGGCRCDARKVLRNGISATKVDVIIEDAGLAHAGDHGHVPGDGRRWQDIKEIVNRSLLPNPVKNKGLAIFRRIFDAEGRVHGANPDEVHLHELGAVDCLMDIFGTVMGLEILGIEKIYCSPVNVGSGTVSTAHGILPVPAPATIELLKGYSVYSSSADFELTTPTGAAILSGLGAAPSVMPLMRCEKTGYGAGNRDAHGFSNTLRIVIGTEEGDIAEREPSATVCVIETNIDDMNPQIFDSVMERLFSAGALDVFLESIVMKKGRPAVKLSVISPEEKVDTLCMMVLAETTSLGVRFYRTQRKTLPREIRSMGTEFGPVDFKVSRLDDGTVKITPEYDHLRAIADKTGIPLRKLLSLLSRYSNIDEGDE